MSLQSYYDAFKSGYWARSDAEVCPCRGCGWALSEVDTWHKCPIHYAGQPDPEWADCGMDDDCDVADTEPAPPPEPVADPDEDDIPF